jgi:hypothetical protein
MYDCGSDVEENAMTREEMRGKILASIFKTSCGCWIWMRGLHTPPKDSGYSGDYGVVYDGYKKQKAHRAAYDAFVGKIPKGKCVLHKCDIPQCCNPKHLELGTKKDNAVDMISRGRDFRGEPKRGAASHLAVLKDEDVLRIRDRYAAGGISQRLLGLEYGISQTAILKIVRRQRWGHI